MEITKRDIDCLRALSGGVVEGRGGLPFIGEGTLNKLLAGKLIEQVPGGASGHQLGYRITQAGEVILRKGRSIPVKKKTRLVALPSRLSPAPERLVRPDKRALKVAADTADTETDEFGRAAARQAFRHTDW